MSIKPLFLAMLVVFGAASLTLLAGCAGKPTEADNPAAAAAAAPADGQAKTDSPAAPDTQAAADSATAASAPAPVASTEPAAIPDGTLNSRVKAALSAHSTTRGLHVQVSTTEGVVRLSGKVASSVQIDQVQDVVSRVEGVKEINNQLKAGAH